MKRFFVVLVAVAMFLNLVIATGYAAEVVLKLGHIRDLKHPTQKAALKFQERVKKYSDGRIQIKVFPNSQLGGTERNVHPTTIR